MKMKQSLGLLCIIIQLIISIAIVQCQITFEDDLTIKNQHNVILPSSIQLPSSSEQPALVPSMNVSSNDKELQFFAVGNTIVSLQDAATGTPVTTTVSFPDNIAMTQFYGFIGTTIQNRTVSLYFSASTTTSTDKYGQLWKVEIDSLAATLVSISEKSESFTVLSYFNQKVYDHWILSVRTSGSEYAQLLAIKSNGELKLIKPKTTVEEFIFPISQNIGDHPFVFLCKWIDTDEPDAETSIYYFLSEKLEPLQLSDDDDDIPNELRDSVYYFNYQQNAKMFQAIFIDKGVKKIAYMSGSVPKNGISVSFSGEFIFNSVSSNQESKLLMTYDNKLQILHTFDQLALDRPSAQQLLVGTDVVYVLLDNREEILEIKEPINFGQTLPRFVYEEEGEVRLRMLDIIGSSLIVEYCVQKNNIQVGKCNLGYYSRKSKQISIIPMQQDQQIDQISSVPSMSSPDSLTLLISSNQTTQLIQLEFKTDAQGKCFPQCGTHGQCDEATGTCICRSSNDEGHWQTDSRGVCAKCAKGYLDDNICKTEQKTIKCYNVEASDVRVCSGHGICQAKDKCVCDSDSEKGFWSGVKCDKCLNNFDKSLGCKKCKMGWQGDKCDKKQEVSTTLCYGIPATSASVCGYHGECLQNGTCKCNQDHENGFWTGEQCQQCLNQFSFSSNCNMCLPGYEGSLCDKKIAVPAVVSCFGLYNNQSEVCSGHGKCVNNDTCVCEQNFKGEQCENTWCFGIASNSDNACSGSTQGACVGFNECKCRPGFTSYDCRVWNEGKGLWITTVVMSGLTGTSVLVLLAMVCFFKLKHGQVEYMSLSGMSQIHSDDDDEEDLFINEDDEYDVEIEMQPSNQNVSSISPVVAPEEEKQQPANQQIVFQNDSEDEDDEEPVSATNNNINFSLEDSDDENKL